MRVVLNSLMGLICIAINNSLVGQCVEPEEPIPFIFAENTIITDCGNEFDLCMDFYNLDNGIGQDTFVLNIFSNDAGAFDYCASDTMPGASTKHGKLIRLPSCQWAYVPGNTFTDIDSFDYLAVINDSCINDSGYCDAGKGKFWTIFSRYEGSKQVDTIITTSKKGNSFESVPVYPSREFPLDSGDYFFADGQYLSKSQSTWAFTFYYTDESMEIVDVHTSCSAPILNLTHPVELQGTEWVTVGNIMTPVSGCVTTNGNQLDCNDSPQYFNRNKIKTRAEVTTQSVDTTRVYIVSNNTILPIRLNNFRVKGNKTNNFISWEVISVSNEYLLTLQKSYDGKEFFNLLSIDDIKLKPYNYIDVEVKNSLNYYRLSTKDYNGVVKYSNILVNRRPEYSRKISIFPNPASEKISIAIDGLDKGGLISAIMIYDIRGVLIKHNIDVNRVNTILDLDNILPTNGLYLLRLEMTDGDVLIDKFLKK